ncbi:hypothetical protein, partial [Methylobacterium oxalidis]|uniref:hypothetical protein n=1 Tax=Methylobacterium oxalidis TaxID=944322 RepID=UPI0033154BA1
DVLTEPVQLCPMIRVNRVDDKAAENGSELSSPGLPPRGEIPAIAHGMEDGACGVAFCDGFQQCVSCVFN